MKKAKPTKTELMRQPKGLSDDAWYFGKAMFSMMAPDGTLTFRMKDSRPTVRSQNALDELVKAGMVSVEPYNSNGGKVYRPLVQFPRNITNREHNAMGHWTITEKIT